mmetsp:Transcript_32886/g.78751  ORF Transcript_32886/g.78751 Transcript_32886/m.78751 type:complete len:227 (-) Transcript_32886:732-1412(-)
MEHLGLHSRLGIRDQAGPVALKQAGPVFGTMNHVDVPIGAAHVDRAISGDHRRTPLSGEANGSQVRRVLHAQFQALHVPSAEEHGGAVELPARLPRRRVQRQDAARLRREVTGEGAWSHDHQELALDAPHRGEGAARLRQQVLPFQVPSLHVIGPYDSRLVDSAGGIPVVAAGVDQAVGPQTCASVGGGVLAVAGRLLPDCLTGLQRQAVQASSLVHDHGAAITWA